MYDATSVFIQSLHIHILIHSLSLWSGGIELPRLAPLLQRLLRVQGPAPFTSTQRSLPWPRYLAPFTSTQRSQPWPQYLTTQSDNWFNAFANSATRAHIYYDNCVNCQKVNTSETASSQNACLVHDNIVPTVIILGPDSMWQSWLWHRANYQKVRILAETVIVWALGKSISTASSYQRNKYGAMRAVMALSVDQFCAPMSNKAVCSSWIWDGIRN